MALALEELADPDGRPLRDIGVDTLIVQAGLA